MSGHVRMLKKCGDANYPLRAAKRWRRLSPIMDWQWLRVTRSAALLFGYLNWPPDLGDCSSAISTHSMRNNQPVTQREYQFPADQTLVSVTDRHGHITYCNPAFVEISGYTEDELLGQPHNIVRHPDMPAEAFRDLWETAASGQLWSALVKNRRKNGDHYWVKAHVTPISDDHGQVVGFMSVRTRSTRAEVRQAEQLHARLRAEAAHGRQTLRLRQGQVSHRGPRVWTKAAMTAMRANLIWSHLMVLSAVALLARFLPLPALLLALPLAAWLLHWQHQQRVIKPLGAMLIEMRRLASGDLSGEIGSGRAGVIGQLQQALVQMTLNMRTVIRDVREESTQLHKSIEEIAAGNRDLSARTESASSSLEETTAAMKQFGSIVQHSSLTARTGAAQSRQSAGMAERSHAAVLAVADTMSGITESSRRISEITQVIEGVAFQTNILALNAAVEAARAGASGRGFSVVATEVRSLAQRAAEAAREIKQLITESAQRVHAGSERTVEARDRMQEALSAVRHVATVLDEINQVSQEQREGITQIGEAITHLDRVTQQNAAMVEELSATADSLRIQSRIVSSSIHLFRL